MIKKLSLAVCASLMGISSQVVALSDNAVVNKVADTYAAKNQQQAVGLAEAFKQLKSQWQTQRLEDQKRLDASLAENKALAEKLQALETRFNSSTTSEPYKAQHTKAKTSNEYLKAEVSNPYPTTVRNRGGRIGYVEDDADYGNASTFDAYPSSQVPLYMLKGRNNFGDKALVFGGYLETDASGFWGDSFDASNSISNFHSTGHYQNGVNLNLTTANFDVMVNINKWIQSYITFSSSDLNSPVIQNAFVTFGNLEENPFFLTVGKNRIPTGVWAGGGVWIAGMTQGYFRPAQFSNVMASYYNDGLNLNVAGFVPETNSNTGFKNEGDFMLSFFYSDIIDGTMMTYGVNGSFLYNWANTGMGSNGIPAGTPGNITGLNPNQDKNSVLNFEGNLAYKEFAIFSGWAGLTNKRNYTNNGFAGAWYMQSTYSPILFDQVTVFGASWGQAYNANELFFPTGGQAAFGVSIQGVQKEFVVFAQRPILTPQVLLGIEYGWLSLYNGAQTSEITMDLSVYF